MVTKKMWESFRNAFSGFRHCVKNERNFRIHISAAILAYMLSNYYQFTDSEMVMLTLVIGLVIISEMFNTAVEAIVDLVTEEYHELAKKAKDVAAGAVLFSAFCSVVSAIFLFFRIDKIKSFINTITLSPLRIFEVLLLLILLYLFVRGKGD